MEISELVAYAEQKYHMLEEYKWTDFPGFSVLTDPVTNKWVALLMRKWDPSTGTQMQYCDIKCGRKWPEEIRTPYTGPAFRMKGDKWVGVLFNGNTEPDVVCQLLDEAVSLGRQRGYTVVIDDAQQNTGQNRAKTRLNNNAVRTTDKRFTDTLLPLEYMRGNYDKKRFEKQMQEKREREKRRQESRRRSDSQSARQPTGQNTYKQLDLFSIDPRDPSSREFSRRQNPQDMVRREAEQIPPRILEMMKLYDYTDGSFYSRCRNFRKQGMYMADYEDDASWGDEVSRYFTTYHDLNLKQLRGYFAWRAHVRNGDFNYITPSMAYMYLYELLNGIGTSSVEESLNKMKEFEAGYLDSGIGDALMRNNLRRWMLELAVLSDLPAAEIMQYILPATIARDGHLVALRTPQEHSDEEIFAALSALSDGKIEKSTAVTKEPARGKHLFAEVWRHMSQHYKVDGWDIFTACFGKIRKYAWHPLGNAVYMDREDRPDKEYQVTACRKYVHADGSWYEEKYDELYFDKYKIHAVMHEADRQIRRYLKTGHYLHEKQNEEWVTPYVEAVIEADKAAIEEAAKPKITIDLSGLDKIRRDAQITRDSLLIEDEVVEPVVEPAPVTILPPVVEEPQEIQSFESAAKPDQLVVENTQTSVRNDSNCAIIEFPSLDEVHGRILLSLMRGEPVADMIRDNHLMASVVTDTINEAMFDEIGDNVLECDGEEITLVEDYREDLDLMLEGDS